MLSILIPIYAYDTTTLVETLHTQGKALGVPFEILVFDDGSQSEANQKNEKLNLLEHVTFKALEKNLGRSGIRNLLAKTAKYENFLFIDGDSDIISDTYLQAYLKNITPTTQVIYGGRTHSPKHPHKDRLRWKYGKFREDKTAGERRKAVYRHTIFNNTLVKKELALQIRFEEKLTKYGHEDSLLAYKLFKAGIPVQHIDNPVSHKQIESNEVFLKKTRQGLKNLKWLCREGFLQKDHIRLTGIYFKIKKTGMDKVLGGLFPILRKPMEKNLLSTHPSLHIFTAYKLMYFCRINPMK